MSIIHTMPLLIRSGEAESEDIKMLAVCLESLSLTENSTVVIYNQGTLSRDDLTRLCSRYNLNVIILGEGSNVGIAQARQACFRYIWENHPETEYISEIHVDMVFPRNWHVPLTQCLSCSEEPMLSPGILTLSGELQPIGSRIQLPATYIELIEVLNQLPRAEISVGFVHPVVHKSAVLQQIGGYDTDFLKGKQGYEDDSLLLGYLYYMGTRSGWRPKCLLSSWVYHATMAQRMSLPDRHEQFHLNEKGLFQQYGAYGMRQLSAIHANAPHFKELIHKYTAEENA